MARRTLVDYFEDFSSRSGDFIVYDDGYRAWTYRYRDVIASARGMASRLRAAGIRGGDKIIIWSENRPEWIILLWGCLLEGVVLVPIDYRASADLMLRVADIVDAKVIVAGETVSVPDTSRSVWRTDELDLQRLGGHSGTSPSPENGARAREEGAGRQQEQRPEEGGEVRPGEYRIQPDTTAEILFTSGATAEPKGVVLTHRNILANIVPVEREVNKYRRYAKPFSPIRFLNLLPLSHMFGQSMATFVPPMLDGVVVFMRSYSPHDIVRQIRERRISVLVCVPKMLEVLRDHVLRVHPETADAPPAGTHWAKRWWLYRKVHRTFGFKFWAIVVGAAPLDPELEAFWGRLGFLVIQGYGLTETAPIVTLNHPFHAAKGAVGKPIGGVEVKIADDGEILVRGENVTSGYYNAPEETRRAFADGWFHTGDIGEVDESGNLRIRGRKKEMIVTPEGLNVFPDDVERVLNLLPGVRESAVVGAALEGSAATERVHAIVVTDEGVDLDSIVREANARLLDHQKIRAVARWTGGGLPRTEGTRKLKRRELKQWLAGQGTTSPQSDRRDVTGIVQRFTTGQVLAPETTLEQLGLSSLERVELMMALEDAFQVTIDETRFSEASTLRDLEALVEPIQAGEAPASVRAPEELTFPSWNRSLPARAVRTASLPTWILPPMRLFVSLEVRGLHHLAGTNGPVIFAANHQSHLDTPAILQALPRRWRYRVAPAMLKEFFKAHFHPDQYGLKPRLTSSLNYYLATLFFAAFPLPQREVGARQTLRYIGEVVADGFSILIYPEGKRTDAGEINRFQPGVGMIASRLGIPVVPVRIQGLERILHHTWAFPSRGRASVTFGGPMSLKGNDYAALAAQVEEAVRELD